VGENEEIFPVPIQEMGIKTSVLFFNKVPEESFC
jgi:hypothetical protein